MVYTFTVPGQGPPQPMSWQSTPLHVWLLPWTLPLRSRGQSMEWSTYGREKNSYIDTRNNINLGEIFLLTWLCGTVWVSQWEGSPSDGAKFCSLVENDSMEAYMEDLWGNSLKRSSTSSGRTALDDWRYSGRASDMIPTAWLMTCSCL